MAERGEAEAKALVMQAMVRGVKPRKNEKVEVLEALQKNGMPLTVAAYLRLTLEMGLSRKEAMLTEIAEAYELYGLLVEQKVK